MRIIRSRSSKACAVNKSQRKSKSEASLLSGSSWGLVVLAVLPLVAMVMVSLCNYLGTLSLFVAYQRPKYVDEVTHSSPGTLSQSSGQVMSLGEFYKLTFEKTTPTHWSYATDEHFITNHPPLLKDVGPNKYADEDYFQLFPEEVKPRNAMLLWGTKHSRSKLHVDPYNWTGTIALLKGVKKWKMWPLTQVTNSNSISGDPVSPSTVPF
ncbi:hypothetical protein EB796_006654 [Bugula neritina]|uniref:JMJD6 n=1 Tax=Bugula neritina TaxID=10212 RepID=A0A7J7K8S9_BUGNE|nr:hypothetical protein EB796_006654 [Bugula neritina]